MKPQACESCGDSHAITGCTEASPICAPCCAEFQANHGPVDETFAPAPGACETCGAHLSEGGDDCGACDNTMEA
jgi:hypothetical protein